MPLGSVTPPPTIPGFEFVSTLGAGGFSDVYLYQQKMPRRRVAVKVLRIDALDRTLRRQFVAEANLMAQLSSHPAIATIYAADVTEDSQPYLVMEYCSGGSFGTAYKAAPLPIAEVLRVGIRVSSALEAAHRLGIVHRDIKPANILITDYGLPVLTDFGISIGDDGIGDSTMFSSHEATEASGSSHGLSIPWAPPEAFADEPTGTAQSDVFSLAATLFTLLEGRSPFEIRGANNGPVQLSRRIETGAITPGTREGVPESLRAALAKGMATNPADRFPTALALADALQLVQAELGQPVTQLELPVTAAGVANPVPAIPAAVGLTAEPAVPEEPLLETIVVDRTPAAPDPVTPPAMPPAEAAAPPAPAVPATAAVVPAAALPPYLPPAAIPPAAVPPAPVPPLPAGNPKRKRNILIAAGIAAIVIIGVAGGTAITLWPDQPTSSSQSRDDNDDEEQDDDEPAGATTVAMCDDDYREQTAELWEVDVADLLGYTDGTDDLSLSDAGLDPICGLSTATSPYYVDHPVQEVYYSTDGSDDDVNAVLDSYGNCDEPTDWSTFTSWTCSTGDLFVSIRQYTEDLSYLRPDEADGPYLQVISYTY